MAELIQQALNGNEIAAIVTAISPDRFKTYLTAAGHNQERALRLYLWNARLGGAFHMPQAVEVALRNNVNLALSNVYTANWWECKNLYDLLDEERRADLTIVVRRIRNRELELYTGQVVAGLSFGFWVGMLHGRYNHRFGAVSLELPFPHSRRIVPEKACMTGCAKSRPCGIEFRIMSR
jgi:hypothetical protein